MSPDSPRSNPSLFKQGLSQKLKLFFFTVAAFFTLYVDYHYNALSFVRQTMATLFTPLDYLARMPVSWGQSAQQFISVTFDTHSENRQLRKQLIELKTQQQVLAQLTHENQFLRQQLALRARLPYQLLPTQMLRQIHSPYLNKVIIDRGSLDGLTIGMPVISADGLVGQLSRVALATSEVTLTVDSSLTVPVQIARTGLRAVTMGNPVSGTVDLRFISASADVLLNDLVVTSGIDGLYPGGLPVCKVEKIDRIVGQAFNSIRCYPNASLHHAQYFVVLAANPTLPATAPTGSATSPGSLSNTPQ